MYGFQGLAPYMPAGVIQINAIVPAGIDSGPRFHQIPAQSQNLKWVAKQLDSVYELLPDDFYLPQHPVVYPSYGRPYNNWRETYIVERCRFPEPEMKLRAEKAMQFKEDLAGDLPGAKNLVVYGPLLSTDDRCDFSVPFG
jgi:hypothetical protein